MFQYFSTTYLLKTYVYFSPCTEMLSLNCPWLQVKRKAWGNILFLKLVLLPGSKKKTTTNFEQPTHGRRESTQRRWGRKLQKLNKKHLITAVDILSCPPHLNRKATVCSVKQLKQAHGFRRDRATPELTSLWGEKEGSIWIRTKS